MSDDMKKFVEDFIKEYPSDIDSDRRHLDIAKAYLALTSELERVKRQLGVAVGALESGLERERLSCYPATPDRRILTNPIPNSDMDSVLAYDLAKALAAIKALEPPHET